MRSLRLALFLFTASLATATVTTYTWSGNAGDHQYTNPANWVNGVVPPNNGTAVLVFGNASDTRVVLPLILDVAQIQFQNTPATSYSFDSALLTLLTVQNGFTNTSGGTTRIDSSITLNLDGTQNFDVTTGSLEIAGGLIGNGNLVKTGEGSLRLSGFNLLLGNAQVETGALIFTNANAVPSFGTITSNHNAYVGAENNSTINSLINQIDPSTFLGSLGLDTAPNQSTPTTFSTTLNLSALTQFTGLGSSTTARLTGNIQLAPGQHYRFGGGNGTLYIESNLDSANSELQIKSTFGDPLTLVLRGTNNFSRNSFVSNALLVLDSAHAAPANTPLTIDGPGYIGATENFATTPSSFLSLIHATSANSIVGFDSANLAAPRTITQAIDLSLAGTRTTPYYLGTSSKVTLTGTLTPTVGDSLYLTAVKGGHLVVGSTLGNNLPGLVVGQANSFDPQGGIVEITGNNNYTSGTKVLGGTLRVSNNAALGTGSVAVANRATLDLSSGILFSNPFTLSSGARLAGNGTVGMPGGAVFGTGTILSPGGVNAIGTLTFASGLTLGSGSVFEFDLSNLNGAAGTGWDLIAVNGLLNLNGTAASPITINLSTLTPNGVPGHLNGFNSTQSYSWLFATAGSIEGFSSDKFTFSTANFANNLGNGNFLVTQGNAGLSINFTPVPEPGTYVLFAVGLAVVAILEHRRRKNKPE